MGTQFPNSPLCLTGSAVWLFHPTQIPPPTVLDYYSSYMAGHMYSFCFLITLKFFQRKTEQAYSCLMGIFLVGDLRIILNGKKKMHSPKELWVMNGKGPKNRLGCFIGQSNPSLLSSHLSSSSTLDFHMFSLVKVTSSPSSGKWKILGFPRHFGFALKFVGGVGWETCSTNHKARSGKASHRLHKL